MVQNRHRVRFDFIVAVEKKEPPIPALPDPTVQRVHDTAGSVRSYLSDGGTQTCRDALREIFVGDGGVVVDDYPFERRPSRFFPMGESVHRGRCFLE